MANGLNVELWKQRLNTTAENARPGNVNMFPDMAQPAGERNPQYRAVVDQIAQLSQQPPITDVAPVMPLPNANTSTTPLPEAPSPDNIVYVGEEVDTTRAMPAVGAPPAPIAAPNEYANGQNSAVAPVAQPADYAAASSNVVRDKIVRQMDEYESQRQVRNAIRDTYEQMAFQYYPLMGYSVSIGGFKMDVPSAFDAINSYRQMLDKADVLSFAQENRDLARRLIANGEQPTQIVTEDGKTQLVWGSRTQPRSMSNAAYKTLMGNLVNVWATRGGIPYQVAMSVYDKIRQNPELFPDFFSTAVDANGVERIEQDENGNAVLSIGGIEQIQNYHTDMENSRRDAQDKRLRRWVTQFRNRLPEYDEVAREAAAENVPVARLIEMLRTDVTTYEDRLDDQREDAQIRERRIRERDAMRNDFRMKVLALQQQFSQAQQQRAQGFAYAQQQRSFNQALNMLAKKAEMGLSRNAQGIINNTPENSAAYGEMLAAADLIAQDAADPNSQFYKALYANNGPTVGLGRQFEQELKSYLERSNMYGRGLSERNIAGLQRFRQVYEAFLDKLNTITADDYGPLVNEEGLRYNFGSRFHNTAMPTAAAPAAGASAAKPQAKPAPMRQLMPATVATQSRPLIIHDASGNVVGRIPKDANIITVDMGNGTSAVSYNGVRGYVSNQYLRRQ